MPTEFYVLLFLSIIALPLSKYLGTLRVFDTTKQEVAMAEEWTKFKANHFSNN